MSDMVHPVVFLFDVDNTLLDNDRIAADLRRYLTREVGAERQECYWALFEQLRGELGYEDPDGGEAALGRPRDDGLPAAWPLRPTLPRSRSSVSASCSATTSTHW